MGRIGITYDQVAAAADALLSENSAVTLKAVRDKLGTGGMGTIHKHLTAWQANRPKPVAPAVVLPADITRELNAWVIQAATAARAEAEENLVQVQASAFELARAGEAIEAERDDLLEQISALTTERDQEQATAKARAAEIERLTNEIERERKLAGDAQIEAAQAKLKVEDQTGKVNDLKEVVQQLKSSLEEEAAGRVKAEKEAAVLLSERDAARKETQAEKERIQGLQAHLDTAHAENRQLRVDYEKRLADSAEAAGKAIAMERSAADKAGEAAKVAAVENADLKARLDAAEKTIARLDHLQNKSEK
jgi:colicin import membrane protein